MSMRRFFYILTQILISNYNNYNIDGVEVCILYRDGAGNLVGGTYEWADMIPANSVNNYEVYISDNTYSKYVVPGYTPEVYILPTIDEMK